VLFPKIKQFSSPKTFCHPKILGGLRHYWHPSLALLFLGLALSHHSWFLW